MVKAVKAGRVSFTSWFNTLPGWVKAASGGLGADLLYDIIKNALGL